MEQEKRRLSWHPAFGAVLRIELEKELDLLEIVDERQLTKEPLQMDVLVVKKEKDIRLEKNIGRIFKSYNIIEYKSPEDYLSINDFYKVYAYACLYQSDTDRVMEVDPEEITLTFVCMRYPRKLLGHLKETRGIRVSRQGDGIYYLEGDALAMQLLVTRELSERDNYWLQHLRGDLKEGRELQDLMERYERHRHSKWYQAAMDLIVRANWDKMKEEKEMCEALRELFADELQESEERGKEKGKEQGEETKLISLVCKKIRKNKAVSVIAEELEEPEEKISLICETASRFAPDYDADQIYAVLAKKETGEVKKP